MGGSMTATNGRRCDVGKPMTVAEYAAWSRQNPQIVRRQCRERRLRAKKTPKGWLIDPNEASFEPRREQEEA